MLIDNAIDDLEALQRDVLVIERSMDKAVSSMDKFKRSFELFLESGHEYILKHSTDYRVLYAIFDEYEKIYLRLSNYEKGMRKKGFGGFSDEIRIEMSGLVALMNRIQEYKAKLHRW
jgi:hypothetical protein